MKTSAMAASLQGSEILKLASEIQEKLQQGISIHNLTIGDFDPQLFPIPAELKTEITRYYEADATNYPAANGMAALRESISRFTTNRQGLTYDPNHFLVTSGARPLIFATYLTLLDPGEKVIYPVPSWNNNYYTHIARAEGVPVLTSAEEGFMPTAQLLAPHLPSAGLLALCSPLNPTGTVFSRDQLSGICELVLAENARRGPDAKPLYVLYDQIYGNLTYGNTVHCDPVSLFPKMRDYTIYIDGMSKAFCATGLRLGWGFGPPHVIDRMKSILSHAGAWSPKAEQLATAAYLQKDEEVDAYLTENRAQLSQRLTAFYEGFETMKRTGFPVDVIPPQAALYLTVKLDLRDFCTPQGHRLDTGQQVYHYLLEQAQVAMVPFYAFGAAKDSPWFRLSVGTVRIEDIAPILQQLESALALLQPAPEN